MPDTTSVQFNQKTKGLLGAGSVASLEVDARKDAAVVAALAENKPFPDGDIELGTINVDGKAGGNAKLTGPTGDIEFKGSAEGGLSAGLAVYNSGADVIGALDLDDNIAPGVDLADDPKTRFHLFHWGYHVAASGEATVALGAPAGVKLGANGRRERAFAIVRRLPRTMTARTAVRKTVNSFRLPSQIKTPDQLEAGTWIITDVYSKLGLTLGAQFGYDFNWVREAKAGGLSGDIGLKIQTGVNVALGMNVSGKFAVVISRESKANELRLRLFRQRTKGWSFALDASATIDPDTGKLLPKDFDGFVKAVFGTHGAQVLGELDQWTDPSKSLADMTSELGLDYVNDLFTDVTGIDAEQEFQKARGQVRGLLDKWNKLDHDVATRVWKVAESNLPLADIREIAEKVSSFDEDAAIDFIKEKIADVDFLQSEPGQFLTSLVPDKSLLSALTDVKILADTQSAAQKVTEVLDGDTLENTLVKLQDQINKRLKLDKLKTVVDKNSFDALDAWLKQKLSTFLGETATLKKVEEIRKTIRLLFDKRNDFYSKAVKALNKEYEFSLAYAYQKSTSKTALIDVVFDFDAGDPSSFLDEAMSGQFNRLMVEKDAAVKLNAATLTHGIKQQSSVDVSMPFFSSSVKHINASLAKVSAVDEDDGRILVYELGATDVVIRRGRRASSLAVGGYLKTPANSLRIHSTDSLRYSYRFRQVHMDMKRSDIQYQLKPYVLEYFPSSFGASAGGTRAAPFDTWIGDLDRMIDELEFNGTDEFGDTLLSLELNLPFEVMAAWLKAPRNKRAPEYMDMSRRIQRRFRELIPFFYFQDAKKYGMIKPAKVVLAYSSLPPTTNVKLRSNGRVELNQDREVYWDWRDKARRTALLSRRETAVTLARRLSLANDRLIATPGLENLADHYQAGQIKSYLESAIALLDDDRHAKQFESLLMAEAQIVGAAHKAGTKMGEFMHKSSKKPAEAVELLAEFGEQITNAFNKKVQSIFGGGGLRPMGSLLFLEAARAFDDDLQALQARAIMDLSVLKGAANLDAKAFLQSGEVEQASLLLTERLIEIPD